MKTFLPRKCSALALLTVAWLLPSGPSAHAQVTWTGASGFTNVWSEPLNWITSFPPGGFDAVIFDNSNGVTNVLGAINNVVDTDFGIATLTYSAYTNSALSGANPGIPYTNFHSTMILPGVTLTITNASGSLLNLGTGGDQGDDAQVHVVMTGGGNLVVGDVVSPIAATSINIKQGAGFNTFPHSARLDLSGLNNFTVGVGLLLLGDGAPGRDSSRLTLAKTNVIRVVSTDANGAIRMGNNTSGQGGPNEIFLGQENSIYTDYLRIGGQRGSLSTVSFQPGLVNPTVKFRGADTVSRMGQLNVAEARSQTGSNAGTGVLDTTGGILDALVSTMILGYAPNSTSTASQHTGILTMDKGTLDVTSLLLGWQRQNNGAPTVGILNLNGTAQVLAGGDVVLGRDQGNAAGTGTAIVNISNNASMKVLGSVYEVNIAPGGSASSTINMNGGNLNVSLQLLVDAVNCTNGNVTIAVGPAINDANPAWMVTNLTIATGMNLNVQGSGFGLGRYPLIKYTGTIGGDGYSAITLGSLPPRTQGYLSNNVANSSIDIVITNFSFARWEGNVNGNWDTNTPNWKDSVSGSAVTYLQNTIPGESAIFNDAATGTRTIVLTTNLAPSGVYITNSTAPYFFTGPGKITGNASLNKNGANTLVVTNSGQNDFTGLINLNAGTLKLGLAPNRLPTNSVLTVANVAGTTLDLCGQDQALSTISGAGAANATINLGANQLTIGNGGQFDGVISGAGSVRKAISGNFVLGGANTYTGGTFVNGTAVSVVNTSGSGVGFGPVDIASGNTLNIGLGATAGSISGATFITNNGTLFFNSTNDNTVAASIEGLGVINKTNSNRVTLTAPSTFSGLVNIYDGPVRISHSDALGDTLGMTSTYFASPNAHLELMGNITVFENIDPGMKSFSWGDVPSIVNVSGTNTLSGSLELYQGGSYWSFRSDAGLLVINGIINNNTTTGVGRTLRLYGNADGELVAGLPNGANPSVTFLLKHGTGTWRLSGVSSYLGITSAFGGNLIVDGEILSTDVVTVGSIDLTHPFVPGAVTATLSGSGIIHGSMTVNTNGTVAPGNNSIATLSVSNGVTTAGTFVMDVNTDTLDHDQIVSLGNIDFGGTLVINPSGAGTAVTNGASVKLFDAGSYSGAFAAIVPAIPGPGLSWDPSNLTVNGTLAVTSGVNTTPINLTYTVLGNQLKVAWPADHTGWRLLGQTNAANGGITTNWFSVPNSTTTNELYFNVNRANGSVYYRLVYP